MSQPGTASRIAGRPRWLKRRLILLAALAAAWCAAGLLSPAPWAAAATLTNVTWSVSNSAASATGVAYTFSFTTATTSTLSSVTMTVPAGTTANPSVGTVTPAGVAAGGSVQLQGTTLTYSFTAASIPAGTAVSIQVTGLKNTSTAGIYTSAVTTLNGAAAVDTGTSNSVTVTPVAALGNPAWAATSTTVGAGSTYTFGFTAPLTTLLLTSMTMTVPAGTTGTPTLGTVTPAGLLGTGTITLTGTTLTYSGTLTTLAPGTAVSIQVKGLTNTNTSGTYISGLTTSNGLTPTATGTTNSLSFTGGRNLTTPGSLGWSGALTGANLSLVDQTAADQQLTVNDATGTGAGWHLALAATTFTSGSQTLPNAGTFVFTNSHSVTSTTRPSTACVTTCTLPGNNVTYPVAVTTATSSPTPSTIWSAPAGTGLGGITIGGSTSASPVGWWVNVPGATLAGNYTSTITVQMISGP